VIRGNHALWRDYQAQDFHPSQHAAELALPWLRDNAGQFTVVDQDA
jgi:hypothetical protein